MESIINAFYKKSNKSKLDKLIDNCKEANEGGGLEAVKELCRNTKGEASAAIYFFIDEVLKKNKN